MAYRVLILEEIPRGTPNELLLKRQTIVPPAKKVCDAAEELPRTLVAAQQPDDTGTLAAYIDFRKSKKYPRLEVGIKVILREIRYESASLYAVDCLAHSDDGKVGRCFHLNNKDEAKSLLLAFIEYAATLLDPEWLVEVDRA